jgi:4-hydroxybenzoate polyprenyltransferase
MFIYRVRAFRKVFGEVNLLFKKIRAFASLYRPDVPVIVFTGSIAGRILTIGFEWNFVAEALFLALFPYNFVYILNSITDRVEDSVDKPWRPLPSGAITEKEALIYLFIVTSISVAGIPLIFSGHEIFLAYLVILLGFSYSMKPLAFKNRGILASVVTGWGVVHPVYITGGSSLAFTTTCLLFHGVGVTLLKGLSDLKGDAAAGRTLITDRFSLPQIFLLSLSLMLFSFISFFFTGHPVLSVIPLSCGMVLSYNFIYRKNEFCNKIYKRIIWTAAASGIFTVIFYL